MAPLIFKRSKVRGGGVVVGKRLSFGSYITAMKEKLIVAVDGDQKSPKEKMGLISPDVFRVREGGDQFIRRPEAWRQGCTSCARAILNVKLFFYFSSF